jgi:hypothetical protein
MDELKLLKKMSAQIDRMEKRQLLIAKALNVDVQGKAATGASKKPKRGPRVVQPAKGFE